MIIDRPLMTDGVRDSDDHRFRVLATCSVFEPGFRGGGPINSVTHIVDTVSPHIAVSLITSDRDIGSSEPYPGLPGRWVDRGQCQVFYLNIRKVRQWLGLRRQLHEVPFGLLYTNSLWNPFFTVIPIVAARLGLIRVKKILIAPRGELSPGALSLKARKKRLFLKWWGPFLRRMDVIWHASTEREASEIRAVCPWASTEISLDQFSLPAEPVAPKAHSGVPRLVFIGRVSPKKNLSLTLKALGNVSGAVEFDIYGPLEDTGYWSKCQSLIARLPHTVRVRYRGELLHADVPRTFSHYDAFVFPTLGENFGHVIAESLSVSCPVVCSDETPWSPVLESGGGIVVRDLTAQALAGDLQRIAAMTPEERLQARYRAGDAYRVWHGTVDRNNILDKVRLSPRSSPR